MTKTLKWRLKTAPTVDEVTALVSKKILTTEEARQILVSETDQDAEPTALENLEAEVKLLREMVMSLAARPAQVVEVIKRYEPYWHDYKWYKPYYVLAQSTKGVNNGIVAMGGGVGSTNALEMPDKKFDHVMQVSHSTGPQLMLNKSETQVK